VKIIGKLKNNTNNNTTAFKNVDTSTELVIINKTPNDEFSTNK